MNMLLTEHLSPGQAKLIVEAKEVGEGEAKRKRLYMSGIFIEGGVRNLNERVYPVSEIEKAVGAVNRLISEGYSVPGELDHPDELNLNLNNISHVIEEMWMDGNKGMGKLRILSTPSGQIARTLIEEGVRLGVSSRGSGNVNESGNVSDFEIVTVDIVARPSAPHAYPKAVFERKIHDVFNTRRGPIVEDLARAVKHDPKAQEHLKKELLEWINKLRA